MSFLVETVAVLCLVWSCFIFMVEGIGITSIFKHFSRPPAAPISPTLEANAPHVTIIRPVKGLETHLYDCIASSFRQRYPIDKLSIRLCVAHAQDPAYPLLQKLVKDFPDFDAQVLIESEDTEIHGSSTQDGSIGPNPKVRNISRAYREAKGDIIWVIDCNVWVDCSVVGRMVDKLMGFTAAKNPVRPYKFVHNMPLVVDIVDYSRPETIQGQSLLSSASEASATPDLTATTKANPDTLTQIRAHGGGRLDEMFMATTHAKFYGAINQVGIAPCVVGKSNMFRKSHLDLVTDPSQNPILPKDSRRRVGIDYFSHNICEDHLIGDILWRSNIPGHRNHGIAWGDVVIQPMAGMSVAAYAGRRVRWLRARKFTVLAATLVEPGVESLVCCAQFAFAVTTLPWFHDTFGVPQTWSAMGGSWLLCITAWMLVDWLTYCRLHAGRTLEHGEHTPVFVKGLTAPGTTYGRSFVAWLFAWIVREVMALPIWTWAVLFGMTVTWRGKTFQVRSDTTVVEMKSTARPFRGAITPELERGRQSSKDRQD